MEVPIPIWSTLEDDCTKVNILLQSYISKKGL